MRDRESGAHISNVYGTLVHDGAGVKTAELSGRPNEIRRLWPSGAFNPWWDLVSDFNTNAQRSACGSCAPSWHCNFAQRTCTAQVNDERLSIIAAQHSEAADSADSATTVYVCRRPRFKIPRLLLDRRSARTLMELKEGTTSPAYTQPMLVMKEGVKKHSSVGASNQLSVILSTRSCVKQQT